MSKPSKILIVDDEAPLREVIEAIKKDFYGVDKVPVQLFVDDHRACPKGWIPARTVTEAIRILATMDVDVVSLDHDIQCGDVSTGAWTLKEGVPDPSYLKPHTSPETFKAVAYYLAATMVHRSSVRGTEDSPTVFIHTGNVEEGRKMAEILNIPFAAHYRYYPQDFREWKDVKELWEGGNING